jgi:trigger factor
VVNAEQTEFENEIIRVKVVPLPNCRVTLRIFVSPLATEAVYRKAIKNVSKEVSVPGFRKGKAPEKVITTQYAKNVDQEWRDLTVNIAFNDATKLTMIHPIHQSSIQKPTVVTCTREQGAEIAVTFERAPQVPQIDPKTLKLKKLAPHSVTAEQVEQAVEDLQRYHAKWETIEPRPVQDGDYVTLTIDTLDPQITHVCTEERFHIKREEMSPWIYDLIVGREVNVPFEGMSQPTEKEPTAAPTRCRFTVHSILHQDLPSVDDALAKQAGCQDVEELKNQIRKSLERRAQQQAETHMTHQLKEQLFELYPIDIPKTLLQYEVDVRMKSAMEAQESLGISEAERRAKKGDLTRAVQNLAERSTKLLFILDSIMRRPEITVTKDDLIRELNQQRYLVSPAERLIHNGMEPEEIRQRLINHLFEKKALALLLKEATYE